MVNKTSDGREESIRVRSNNHRYEYGVCLLQPDPFGIEKRKVVFSILVEFYAHVFNAQIESEQ